MEEITIGKRYNIHSYKHNGEIHRSWDEAVLLDVKKDYMVFGNNKTIVIESDGRTWRTKEPAIMYFYKNNWFNIIGQIKKEGIYYYCNIASPYIIEENTIKYIDYDLDLRVYANKKYKVLDKSEYKYHKEKMHYSNEIDYVLKAELSKLIELQKRQNTPFDDKEIERYYEIYKKTTK